MQRRDVFEIFRESLRVALLAIDIGRHVPELPEVTAALVGRIFAPEQLAGKLVIQAGEIGLDERLIGLQERDRVVRNQLQIGDEVVAEMPSSGAYIASLMSG